MTTIDNPHDLPESVEARKNQEDPWVLYLIVRSSLGMSIGKTAAQVGHAVGLVYEYAISLDKTHSINSPEDNAALELFNSWRTDSFRKITLQANDKKWEKLKKECTCFVVRDAGLTEVSAGSETVISLWPMRKSLAPKVIRKMQTLTDKPVTEDLADR